MIERRKGRSPGMQVDALSGQLWADLRSLKLLSIHGGVSPDNYRFQKDNMIAELRWLRTIPRGLDHNQLVDVLNAHESRNQERDKP